MHMWPTLLAGSFAVIGVLVGQALGRRTEHEKWLRTQRQQAYMDLIAFADEFATSGTIRTIARETLTVEIASRVETSVEDALARIPGIDVSQLDLDELRPGGTDFVRIHDAAWEGVASALDLPKSFAHSIGVITRADEVIAAVSLIAPSEVATAAQDLANMTKALVNSGDAHDVSYDDWRQARHRFITLARQDMSVKGGPPPLEE